MRLLRKIAAVVGTGILLSSTASYAEDPISFKFHITDTNGYGTQSYQKAGGTRRASVSIKDISRDSIWYQKKSVNMLIATGSLQLTDNKILSAADQIPSFPSSANFDYVHNGNFYGWKVCNVSLRANSTETQPGFTVTGTWVPNAGTDYLEHAN